MFVFDRFLARFLGNFTIIGVKLDREWGWLTPFFFGGTHWTNHKKSGTISQ